MSFRPIEEQITSSMFQMKTESSHKNTERKGREAEDIRTNLALHINAGANSITGPEVINIGPELQACINFGRHTNNECPPHVPCNSLLSQLSSSYIQCTACWICAAR